MAVMWSSALRASRTSSSLSRSYYSYIQQDRYWAYQDSMGSDNMADIALLTAQISSVIASIVGICILIYLIFSFLKLTPDRFRTLIILSIIFFFIVIIGVSTMTVYHLTYSSPSQELHELTENGWYIFMFLSLIFLIIESLKLSSFEDSMIKNINDKNMKIYHPFSVSSCSSCDGEL